MLKFQYNFWTSLVRRHYFKHKKILCGYTLPYWIKSWETSYVLTLYWKLSPYYKSNKNDSTIFFYYLCYEIISRGFRIKKFKLHTQILILIFNYYMRERYAQCILSASSSTRICINFWKMHRVQEMKEGVFSYITQRISSISHDIAVYIKL